MHRVCARAYGGQKRALGSPELELQMIVSRHVGAGSGTWILCKSSHFSEPLSHLSSASTPDPGTQHKLHPLHSVKGNT